MGKNKKAIRAALFIGVFVGLGVFIGYGLVYQPVMSVVSRVSALKVTAQELSSAVKTQDLVKAKEGLAKTRNDLKTVQDSYTNIAWMRMIPYVGSFVADGEHVINATFAGLDAGDRAIEALEPNADLLGLKGGSSFVSGSADERIQTAVKTMKALTPKINEMATSIEVVKKEMNAISVDKYPETFRSTPVKSKIRDIKNTATELANLFVNAQPLLVQLPAILGEPNERRYLVIFQNDKELRATGGFITAYAQFRLSRGKMILEKADDIYALDAQIKKNIPAPPEILKFHKDVFVFHLRDSNLSPDYKLSIQKFLEMYSYTAAEKGIDGVIAVDTHVLVEALKILGPMNVYGREFSAEVDKRCNCPKAVYELEDYSTRPVGYVREARKDIIGVLLQQIMQQALGVSPSQYWGRLFQMAIDEINRKHILAYFTDTNAQKATEVFNMAGRIMTASDTASLLTYQEGAGWDYLHINNSNMAGAKSNMFVSDKVTKDTTVHSDGTMTTKLTIDYKNPFPGSDCGLESGGLCLNAPLRNWLRVYVPKGSILVESKGTQSPKDQKSAPMDAYDGLDKTVFEGFLVINPLGSAKVELTYTSPVKLPTDGKYHLLIQKQPGTEGSEYTIKLGGKEKKKGELISDTEYVF